MPKPDISELLNRTLVVVAHPDDEAVGAGALMQRMREAYVVFCTDGGPRDNFFWGRYGSRKKYIAVRSQETRSAAEIARVQQTSFLNFPDQELYQHLSEALHELEFLISDLCPAAILTHAYEGGHPDHDCCAFLSYVLGLRRELPVWEMPLYHRTNSGMQSQKFLRYRLRAVSLRMSSRELQVKQRMVSCYVSQADALQSFELGVERFRRLEKYDFSRPPKTPVINYEAWQWPVMAEQVCAAFFLAQAITPGRTRQRSKPAELAKNRAGTQE